MQLAILQMRQSLKPRGVVSRELLKKCLESVLIAYGCNDLVDEIEAELAKPDPEPIGEVISTVVDGVPCQDLQFLPGAPEVETGALLYTSPQSRAESKREWYQKGVAAGSKRLLEKKPLSDEQVVKIMGDRYPRDTILYYEGFRDAEEAHGIGKL